MGLGEMTEMENSSLKTSLRMSLLIGLLLPLAETLRRSNQLPDPTCFLQWFDDDAGADRQRADAGVYVLRLVSERDSE